LSATAELLVISRSLSIYSFFCVVSAKIVAV